MLNASIPCGDIRTREKEKEKEREGETSILSQHVRTMFPGIVSSALCDHAWSISILRQEGCVCPGGQGGADRLGKAVTAQAAVHIHVQVGTLVHMQQCMGSAQSKHKLTLGLRPDQTEG